MKALGFLSWSLAGFENEDISVEIGGQGLGGTTGMVSWVVGNRDSRDRWGQAARNSSAVGMLSLRVNEVLSFQTRLPADLCWGTVVSSSSSSEGKKSDNGWFLGVLGGDSGCEGSRQLELFKVEIVAVCEGTTPGRQARSFVILGPG